MTARFSVVVPAAFTWTATEVWMQQGDTLTFRADGTWVDAVIPCSADGYRATLFYSLGLLPRIPDSGRYFRLMGRIVASGAQPTTDDIAATFVIGRNNIRHFDTAGRLFVFANDKPGFYWNNWGSVRLSVMRQGG
jgi:hypothetical protein